jgi:diguanylate cyclase (GGDEF)-like protein
VRPPPRAIGSAADAYPEDLAKAWLLGIMERTPLDRMPDLDVELLASVASPLISSILAGLDSRGPLTREHSSEAHRAARDLSRLRRGDGAPEEIPRDLAILQSILIASLRRNGLVEPPGDFADSVQRLAEIFGWLYSAVAGQQLLERAGAGATEAPTAGKASASDRLPGSADLDWWLESLVAEYTRYGHPFGLALVEIEGLEHIKEAHGRRPAVWMLTAVTTVIRNQIRMVDHAFQVGEDEFCVLAPNVDAERLRRMADRLARVIEASQAPDSPRVAISVGVSACPEHGRDGGALLEVAEDALYAAKAAGQAVEVAPLNGSRSLEGHGARS